MESVYLGIDQGSSSTKALVLSESGRALYECSIPVQLLRQEAEHVEQDAEQLLSSVMQAMQQLLDYCAAHALRAQGFGLACQRSGVLAFEKGSGRALSPLLTWRDRSAQPVIDALSAESKARLHEISSLPIIPDYAGAKIALLQQRYPEALVGTLDSFLLYRLSAGKCFVSDDSMAARSMLYDLRAGDWSAEACALLTVERHRLPQIIPSCFPATDSILSYLGVPLTACLGDAQASFYASYVQGASAVLNLGTLGSLCFGLQAGQSFPEGCISSVWLSEHDATQTKRRRSFFAEIIHFSCGSLLQELGSRLQEDGSAYSLRALSGLADSASAEIPVWFYAPRGEATPAWQLRLPTIISRQERLSKSAAARIYFENIAFALALAYQHLRGQGVTIERLLALGGASVCQPILRWFAQITRVSVICSEPQVGATQALTQGSAWGAALAARYGMSVLQEGAQKLPAPVPDPASFEPLETRAEAAVAERFALWCALRQQALTGVGRYAELPAEQRSGSIVLK